MRRPAAVVPLLAALVLGGCEKPAPSVTPTAATAAPKTAGASAAPGSLAVGSPAPALSPVRYLTKVGGPQKFQPGQIYVIDFWATWCGPCIQAMPHLAELQASYADKGVTVIALASPPNKGEVADTEEFAEREGERLKLALALEEKPENYAAFFLAAKQRGIPCTFVIGRDGKIAYIGHPMDRLDATLKSLVAQGN